MDKEDVEILLSADYNAGQQNGVTADSESSIANDSNVLNNPSVPEELQDELEKIKGDMIGDTLYSERWVLKALMSITEKYSEYCGDEVKELDPSLEEDVCTIWDMSAERDVACFLKEHHILDLIESVVSQCQNPRLMEMMIGVLGNLACQAEIRKAVVERENLVYTLVSHLRYPDTLALVQLVRLIRTCLWELRSSPPSDDNSWITALSKQEAYQSLGFIIGSSVEEDLLTEALQLMDTLVYIKLPNDQGYLGKHHAGLEMVTALVEGMKELMSGTEGEEVSISSRKIEEASQHWVSALHGLTFCDEGQQSIRQQAEAILKLLKYILRHFLDQDNWKENLEDHADFLMCGANILCLLLPTDFCSDCLACVVTLLERVQSQGEVSLQESLETCVTTVAAAEGVQTQMLATLDQCHAPEVEMCFHAIAKQDKALLAQLLAELKCTNKHPRLCEIANQLLHKTTEQAQRK